MARIFLGVVAAVTISSAWGADVACEDSNPQCPTWAQAGECDKNPNYMNANCQKSCGVCKGTGPCINRSPKCMEYANKGYCVTKAEKMSKVCPETCAICGPKDPCIADPNDKGVWPGPGDHEAFFRRLTTNESLKQFGMRTLSEDPWVVAFENFVTIEEADLALKQFENGWKRSTAGGIVGMDAANPTRTSEQIWCRVHGCESQTGMHNLVGRIEEIMGISRERYEDTQVLRYQPGQFYRQHWDYIEDHRKQPCGTRLMTFFVYLSDNPGAGTRFTKLGFTMNATKGAAVVWANVKPDNPFANDDRTMHEGLPPVGGPKFSANIWIHQYDFRRYNTGDCLVAGRKLRWHGERKRKQSPEDKGAEL